MAVNPCRAIGLRAPLLSMAKASPPSVATPNVTKTAKRAGDRTPSKPGTYAWSRWYKPIGRP